MAQVLGSPFPIVKNPLGLMRTVTGTEAVKGDLLQLILTNPGERVMLPTFGIPLRKLLFEQNTPTLANTVRNMIIGAIKDWEPRVTILDLQVLNGGFNASLDPDDDLTEVEHILTIKIKFTIPENLQAVDDLTIQLPIGGA